jgi:hypothetical protein
LRARQAYVNDPDGRLIEMYSPLSSDEASGS